MATDLDTQSPQTPPEPLAVGPWTIQADRLLLVDGEGRSLGLRPKSMAVLLCLAEQRGQVVSKEELRRRVWGDVAVGDEVLRRTIFELRQALGDDAEEPRFVETVPRVGYSLRAPAAASASPETAASESPAPDEPAPEPEVSEGREPERSGGSPLLTILLLALLLLGSSAFLLRGTGGSDGPRTAVLPLPATPGEKIHPVLSPDGRRLAFVGRWEDGHAELFLADVPGGASRPLTESPEPEAFPTFDPVGRRLAYLRRLPGEDELRVLDLEAGTDEAFCRLPGYAEGLRWSPAGDLLVLSHRGPDDRMPALLAVVPETCERRRLTTPPPGSHGDVMPAWSPDGSRLAFVRRQGMGDEALLTVAVTDSAEIQVVLPSRTPLSDPLWTPEGASLLFLRAEPSVRRLWQVSAEGGPPRPLMELGEHPRWLSLSSAGDRLTFVEATCDTDLWALDLAAPAGESRRVFRSSAPQTAPALSLHGDRLAYVGESSGHPEIWTSSLDGRDRRRETSFEGPGLDRISWSSEGTALVFEVHGREGRDVAYLALGASPGDHAPRILSRHQAQDRQPVFTKDGTAILFTSDRGGTWQVWRIRLVNGEPSEEQARPIFGGPGAYDEGAGGFYLVDRGRLYRVDETGESEVVSEIPPSALEGSWTVAGGRLFAAERQGEEVVLRTRDLKTGTAEDLVTLPAGCTAPTLAVDHDGNLLVWSATERHTTELWLVEGLTRI